MKNTKMFTKANGETAFLINSRSYKGHVIEKVSRRSFEFYTVDNNGLYYYLRDAKRAIDKIEK